MKREEGNAHISIVMHSSGLKVFIQARKNDLIRLSLSYQKLEVGIHLYVWKRRYSEEGEAILYYV